MISISSETQKHKQNLRSIYQRFQLGLQALMSVITNGLDI